MNWKIFASTFVLVFLAELGDKTQRAVMLQSAVHGRRLVFWAASSALVGSVVLGVLLGGVLSRLLTVRLIHALGGTLFIVIGIWMLYRVCHPGPDAAPVMDSVAEVATRPDPGPEP